MPSYIDDHDSDIEERASVLNYKNVNKGKIISWLKQFDEPHQPIALKVLQQLRFYDISQIHRSCKSLLNIVKEECGDKLEDVIFMGLGSAGKSGSMMLTQFRRSNGMHTSRYENMFKYATEVTALPSSFNGTLVFIDDFIGSGTQAKNSILDIVSIVPPASKILLCVIAGYESAIDYVCKEVEKEIDFNIFPADLLQENEKLFSEENTNFNRAEQEILKTYCLRTGSSYPFGWHDVGSLVIFCDSVPNNTPSILIHEGDAWKPLFQRT